MYQESETERDFSSKKGFGEGFSMVEMLIAVAVSAIVMTALLALLGYTMRSTSQTQTKVAIQNEAKDVVNHMVSHVIEGTHVTWEDTGKYMFIEHDEEEPSATPGGDVTIEKNKKYCYYLSGKKLYFKSISNSESLPPAATDKHLLCDNVESFSAEPDVKDKSTVHIVLKLKKGSSPPVEFECKQDVHIRNKCKGGH